MRIYFEDSKLLPISLADIGKYHIVDAAYGPTACEKDLDWYSRVCPQNNIYTNYLGAMSYPYSWDRENKRYECYIRNSDGHWTNIQNMTDEKLLLGYDIPNLYMEGEFKKLCLYAADEFSYTL